jgi:peptidoglycan/LPS O-acetylase OafA/YrhL
MLPGVGRRHASVRWWSRGSPVVADTVSARVPALDGVRGIAILLVVAGHLSLLPISPRVGVTLFFVLSGYLIATIYRGRPQAFWIRRARRLLPGLLVLLLVIAPMTVAAVGPVALTTFLFVGNWAQATGAYLGPLNHTWSLGTEAQFYLLAPLLLAAALRRWLLLIAAGVAVLRLWLPADWAFFTPIGRLDAFVLGMVAALAGWRTVRPALAVVALLGIAELEFQAPDLLPLILTLGALASTWLVSSAGGWLEAAPLRWLGHLSYGLYLWHYPIAWMTRANGVVVLAASLVLAGLSYRYVERPFIRRRAVASVRSPIGLASGTTAPVGVSSTG